MAVTKFINNWEAALAAGISTSDTSVEIGVTEYDRLATLTGGDFYRAVLYNGSAYEYVKITAKAVSPNITIEREQEGTTGIVCLAGHMLTVANTAAMYDAFYQGTPAGGGDVVGPATNTDNYVPQWSGEDSKTLKDGLAVGTAANNLLQLDGDAKLPAVDGSNLTNVVPASHTHGNVTNDGKVGSAANIPLITGTDGVVQAGAFGTAANTFMQGNDARIVWMFAVHANTDHTVAGELTVTPANGHRQRVNIQAAVWNLTCTLTATYPAIVLEVVTNGDYPLDLGEKAGTVSSVNGDGSNPAVITFEYDMTTLVTGDKVKVTLPASATSHTLADTYEYTLPAAYNETDFLAAFNNNSNWTGTLSGAFSIVATQLVFTYTADGAQTDLADAALGYTLAIWTVWETDGGGAIVLPDTGKCILVLQLSADGTTQYAYLSATEVS